MQSFFRISNRCHDGLFFMSRLAGEWPSGAPLTIEHAAGPSVSSGYLEQVVSTLRAAGLVEGKRGPGGGYVLTRPPERITVREAIEALEGGIGFVDCHGGTCPRSAGCGSRRVWDALRRRVGETFESMTIADIAEPGRSSARSPHKDA